MRPKNLSKKKHITILFFLICITTLFVILLIQEVTPQREKSSLDTITVSKDDERLIKFNRQISPILDGKKEKVLFVTKQRVNDPMILWVFDIKTQKKERLEELKNAVIQTAKFSPNAQFIAYIKSNAQTSLLQIKDLQTGRSLLIAKRPLFAFDYLYWSPDSRFLVYEDGKEINLFDTSFINDSEGKTIKTIGEGVNELKGKIMYYPVWIDTSRFLFLVRSDTNDFVPHREVDVWITDVEGTILKKITSVYDGSVDWELFYFTKGIRYYESSLYSLYSKPLLTANSKHLVFVKRPSMEEKQALWKLNFASGEIQQLEFPWKGLHAITELSISPDGHYLAYATHAPFNLLNLLNLENGKSNILAWHPDIFFSNFKWSIDIDSRYLIYYQGVIDVSEIKTSFNAEKEELSKGKLRNKGTYFVPDVDRRSYSPQWINERTILFLIPASHRNEYDKIEPKADIYLFDLQSKNTRLIVEGIDGGVVDWWGTLFGG